VNVLQILTERACEEELSGAKIKKFAAALPYATAGTTFEGSKGSLVTEIASIAQQCSRTGASSKSGSSETVRDRPLIEEIRHKTKNTSVVAGEIITTEEAGQVRGKPSDSGHGYDTDVRNGRTHNREATDCNRKELTFDCIESEKELHIRVVLPVDIAANSIVVVGERGRLVIRGQGLEDLEVAAAGYCTTRARAKFKKASRTLSVKCPRVEIQ
jgi:hypothetical protein